jgi:hypothetical protein
MLEKQFMLCQTVPELEELIIVSCNKDLGFQFYALLRLVMREGSTQFGNSMVLQFILSV